MYLTVPFLLALLAPSSLSFSSCQKGLCRAFFPLQPNTVSAHLPETFGPCPRACLHERPANPHQPAAVQLQQAAFWVTRAWKGCQGLQSLSYPSSCSLMWKAGVSRHSNQLMLSLSTVRTRVSLEPPCSRQANRRELIIF